MATIDINELQCIVSEENNPTFTALIEHTNASVHQVKCILM